MKAAFRRPRRSVSRFGDPRREWWLADRSGVVVESRGICGVTMPRHYHAIIVVDGRQALVSRHRKLRPAQAAVVRATNPTPKKRKKVR